ncbi:MAG: cupin domain-containing protein [Elainella sp.]
MATDNYCFCELAPLYALDALDSVEREWVEQQVAACPELAEELTAYQLAVTAIPYAVPAPPPEASLDPGLKARLFERLGLEPPAPSRSAPAPSQSAYAAIRTEDLDWQPHPTPGVMVAILHRDEVKREIVGVLRAEPGVHYPFHRHAAFEEIFMMAGDLIVGEEVYRVGDYLRSTPGSSHAPYTTGGCRFFFRTSMDDEYPDLAAAAAPA